jgi:prepilin-type N-terminal cleavage/methylation domain-containing protein
MRRSDGFTAFEIAVTLAIIAIMASFVMPPYLRWLQDHRLRGAAINLVADIEMAKIRAIRENAFVAILFEADGYRIFIDSGANPPPGLPQTGVAGDWEQNGAETLILVRPLPPKVRLALAELAPLNARVRFNSRGLPPEVAGTAVIPLINDSGRKEISLNRLGSATSN